VSGDRPRVGTALHHLGLALPVDGRLEDAITVHQDAVAIFRETGDRHYEGIALGNLEADQNAHQT